MDLKQKFSRLDEYIQKHSKQELFFKSLSLIIMLLLFIFLFSTKIIYPFYFKFVDGELYLITDSQVPMIRILIFTFIAYSLFSIASVILITSSKSKVELIIYLFLIDVYFRALGPFSQNIIFHNDDIVHVGIISRIFDGIYDGKGWDGSPNIQYTFHLFHRFVVLTSKMTFLPVESVFLFIIPLLISFMQLPLILKINSLTKNSTKFTFTIILTFAFPLAGRLWFSITPYIFLIYLFSILISLYPLDRWWKYVLGLIITIIASGVHIHGFFFFFFYFMLIVFSLTKNKYLRFFTTLFFIMTIFAFLGTIVHLYAKGVFQNTPMLIHIIAFRISSPFGEWLALFKEKLTYGGIYAIWYLLQLLFVFVSFIVSLYFLFLKKQEKTSYNDFIQVMSLFSLFNSSLVIWSLFLSYGAQIWRFYYFMIISSVCILVELSSIIFNKLRNFLKKFLQHNKIETKTSKRVLLFLSNSSKWKRLLSFLSFLAIIFFTQSFAYYQFTPYSPYEYEAVNWMKNTILADEQTLVLCSRSISKLIYGIAESNKSAFWQNYWLEYRNQYNVTELLNSTNRFNVFWGDPLSHLVISEIDVNIEFYLSGVKINQIIDAWITVGIIEIVFTNQHVTVYRYL